VRLEAEQAQRGIEMIHGAPVYRLRGNLLPLVYLRRVLQTDNAGGGEAPLATVPADGVINIVVLQADDRPFGLIVDAIHDTEEIVVKPLQKQLKGLSVFAGATIMGDGKVALILDVLGLAQKANVVSGVRERALTEKSTTAVETGVERQTVLLFATRDGGRMAIPLALVSRLEEFPRTAIERVGPQQVVQYREEILPLLRVAQLLGQARRGQKANGLPNGRHQRGSAARSSSHPTESASVQVVVLACKGQRVGLVVDQILDIAQEEIVSRSAAHRPGVLFTAVVQARVTEFLDVERILAEVSPEVLEQAEERELGFAGRNDDRRASAPASVSSGKA
jgi:two-component system chemotaxis sensor kinase CheA